MYLCSYLSALTVCLTSFGVTMSEAIIVACIAAASGILAVVLQGLKKENREDHSFVANSLERIEGKIDGHVRDHATDQV